MKTQIPKIPFCLLLFLLLVSTVAGDCTCDSGDDSSSHKSSTSVKYRVAALFAILIAGAAGVTLPFLSRKVPSLSPENEIFFVIKAFAAGVILSTGFIHILPDAFDSLTSPCLKQPVWQTFPFAGFGAMVGAIGMLMVDTLATGYYNRLHLRGSEENKVGNGGKDEENGRGSVVDVHTHASHGHAHGAVFDEVEEEKMSQLELIRHRVTSMALEMGILVHSVIIGIALGASQSLQTIKPLMAALCFHQFFEGMGLGGCIVQAKFKSRLILGMAFFFSLTTPLGIGIGIGISNGYNENSPRALIVQGCFDSVAAGILVYMALVDLLAADFMNPRMQASVKLQLGSHAAMLLGAACMSILAKWA